ncbi:MAG: phytoene desaturase [Spirochaetaceae bacterium]|nr:MAG: phytoene desaturase [Spirochaetaceae bacterium]
MKRVIVIGSGFGGVSAAAYLARDGYDVTVLEKNSWVGGRARDLSVRGFRFDMGPSWYWMPEEHDRWFEEFGMPREQFYSIRRVDPSYRVYFGDTLPGEDRNVVDVPADRAGAQAVFERYQKGAGAALERYLADCAGKYRIAMSSFIRRNFYTIFDFINWAALRNMRRLNLLQSYGGRIRRFFTHPYLQKILEFPVVFLGSSAARTPAVYTLMNHIDFELGTWYPEGGFSGVVRAMRTVAEAQGAVFKFDHEVTRIVVKGGRASALEVRNSAGDSWTVEADIVVANMDYPQVEQRLLPRDYQSVSDERWDKATLAPAVVNWYLGFDRPLDEFEHHTFFFDEPWKEHFEAVYEDPRWIDNPLFYLHVPSRTDPTCAPEGHEAVFLLVPVAPGLEDTEERRLFYLEHALDRMEARTGRSLRENLVFRQSMSLDDFRRDYHAYKGNAFGLGQTLFQTAWFRMANRSRKVDNLYYTGQYTVPGTGTTMSMISGEVVSQRIRDGR